MPETANTIATGNHGDDLIMCPVCFGHTKLLGTTIYCPNCNMIISSNLSDSLKAKVAIIKEQVGQQQALTTYKKTAGKRAAHRGVMLGCVVVAAVCGVLVSLTGYDILRGAALERAGDYADAAVAFQQSRWLFTLPGITEAVNRNDLLAYSEKEFALGEQAYSQHNWPAAIHYFSQISTNNKHYQEAQLAIKMAQYNNDHR